MKLQALLACISWSLSSDTDLWSKFVKPDFNRCWLVAWTNSQAKNRVNFDLKVLFDLEGQGQWTPKTIGILTKVICTSGPNLTIRSWTGDRLSHIHTRAGNDNTQRPKLASGKKRNIKRKYKTRKLSQKNPIQNETNSFHRSSNRICQHYVYVKSQYWSTMQKDKAQLRHVLCCVKLTNPLSFSGGGGGGGQLIK